MPRVLVVEDDPAISNLVSSALRDDGFEVDTAANGEVGIAKACDTSPGIVVLDLLMPVMDGWEFMRRYRKLPACGDGPILVMTATTPRTTDLTGKYEVLAKPFDLDGLTQAVIRLTRDADSPDGRSVLVRSVGDGEQDSWSKLGREFQLDLGTLEWVQGLMRGWPEQPTFDGLARTLSAVTLWEAQRADDFVIRAAALHLPGVGFAS